MPTEINIHQKADHIIAILESYGCTPDEMLAIIIRTRELIEERKRNLKVLYLTLEKKWFDMILAGIKKQEYRKLGVYWGKRLTKMQGFDYLDSLEFATNKELCFKHFDQIHFFNGGSFSTNYPNFKIECKGISVGTAVPEWSNNLKDKTFIIELGDVIELNNSNVCVLMKRKMSILLNRN